MKKLPKGWEIIKLEKLVDLLNGYAFKSGGYIADGHRVMRITNVQKGILVDSNPKFYPYEYSLERYCLKQDDILISLTGNVGRVGIVEQALLPAYLNQRVGCARIKSNKIHFKYLFHFLNNNEFEKSCMNNAKGIAQMNLSTEFLKEYKIPLPPLDEQKLIAAILDKADELRQKKKQVNAKLDEFLKSTFLNMFGDPVNNPMGWNETNIGDICHFVKDGPHVSPNYTETGVPFISVNNIIKGKWDLEKVKYISKEDHEIFKKRCNPEKGDILYTKGGTTGVAKFIDIDLEFSNWVHLAVLKYNKDTLNGRFFEAMLNSPYCYTQSQKYTRGIANRDLVLGEMKKIKFYLPPINLQNKFAQIVEKVEEQKAKNEIAIKKLDNLFNSLMQKAFKGELFNAYSGKNVIDFATKKAALQARIIHKHLNNRRFGAVKLAKIFNICDMKLELDLMPDGYKRAAAGPYDRETREQCEKIFEENKWIEVQNNNKNLAGKTEAVKYKKDKNFDGYRDVYDGCFSNIDFKIESILKYFENRDTDYCEAFSTLYMCWNDLLLESKKPSKSEIIYEFKNNWSEDKKRFDNLYLMGILSDMESNNFVPKGTGVHTIASDYHDNKDQLKLLC